MARNLAELAESLDPKVALGANTLADTCLEMTEPTTPKHQDATPG